MKKILLDYLVCPTCQLNLKCNIESGHSDEIKTGELLCGTCGEKYRIINGIPRFITQNQPLKGSNFDTASAFGWQWQIFPELHDVLNYEKQFLDWVYPIKPNFFKGKVVLDAGCGMGRFSIVSSLFGSKLVLAVDASDSVEAARENISNYSNVELIQADIHNLPLRMGSQAQIDFIFSIGVLHHLDDPKKGFEALIKHLKSHGTIFAWVYGRENNEWLMRVVNPLRTVFTSKLPRRLLYYLSWLITVGLQPVLKMIYKPINTSNTFKRIKLLLPYNDYFAWLSQFCFRHNHTVIFDHLVAPVAFYISKVELEEWYGDAGLEIIGISARNQNSWRSHGRLISSE
jgi:SAM-dependent methyltransferase/uncharacterized protein YbaR (Trm112 family)